MPPFSQPPASNTSSNITTDAADFFVEEDCHVVVVDDAEEEAGTHSITEGTSTSVVNHIDPQPLVPHDVYSAVPRGTSLNPRGRGGGIGTSSKFFFSLQLLLNRVRGWAEGACP